MAENCVELLGLGYRLKRSGIDKRFGELFHISTNVIPLFRNKLLGKINAVGDVLFV